jgi:hypothetical protein
VVIRGDASMGWTMPCHPVHRLGRRGRQLLLAALLAALSASLTLPVASASANAFLAVQQAYATSPSQTIPPCKFSSSELQQAENSVPNDDQQYDEGLTAAIELASQQRADGACRAKKRQAANATVPIGTPSPSSAPPLGGGAALPVGSATAATDSGLPAPIVILLILGGLLLAGGAALGFARLWGWDPDWLHRSGHSWSEAGYRVSGIWSEFGDWLRGVPH